MFKPLSSEQIEKYANRKGVRKIAVENFLSTLGNAGSMGGELANLYKDTQLYKWKSATVRAIESGIRKAYKWGEIKMFKCIDIVNKKEEENIYIFIGKKYLSLDKLQIKELINKLNEVI